MKSLKKSLSLLLALVMCLGMLPGMALADNAIATVDGGDVTTIADLFNATQSAQNIKFLNTIDMNGSGHSEQLMIRNTTNDVTLDMNGQELKGWIASGDVINGALPTNLTITGNGTVTAKHRVDGATYQNACVWALQTKVTIENGTYRQTAENGSGGNILVSQIQTTNNDDPAIIVNGGTFENTTSGGGGVESVMGKVVINDGDFDLGDAGSMFLFADCGATGSYQQLEVNGGTFRAYTMFDFYTTTGYEAYAVVNGGTFIGESFNHGGNTITPDLICHNTSHKGDPNAHHLTIKGGTFIGIDPTDFVPEGYAVTSTTEGGVTTYTVASNAIATVDGEDVTTIAALREAARDASSVVLKADIDLTNSGWSDNIILEHVGNVTFDLNGHTLKGELDSGSTTNGADSTLLTLKDSVGTGEIVSKYAAGSQGEILQLVSLITWQHMVIVESGTYTNTDGGTIASQLQSTDPEHIGITVNGGTFNAFDSDCVNVIMGNINLNAGTYNVSGGRMFYLDSGSSYIDSTINAKGGTYDVDGDALAYFAGGSSSLHLNISGGTYDLTDCSKLVDGTIRSQDTFVITGGTFIGKDPSDYVATGYAATETSSGTWTVQPAAAKVAQIGDAEYETLAEAFAAAEDGNTITLLSDVTLSEAKDLDFGANSVTLDLGGKTLTAKRLNLKRGNLTVQNGTVVSNGQAFNVYGSTEDVGNYTNLTIAADATVNAPYAICLFPVNNDVKLSYGANINIYGKLYGTNGTVFVSGNLGDSEATGAALAASENISKITVYDGAVISSANDQAIAMNGMANVIVNGGTITGREAIGLKRGNLNVKGGALSATGPYVDPATANNNGTEATGATISITSTYNYAGVISANIENGTFSSTNGTVLYVGHSSKNNASTTFAKGLSLSISEGTLTAGSNENAKAVYVAEAIPGDSENYPAGFITGGTFSSNPSAYVATGYAATQIGLNWIVGKAATKTENDTTTTAIVTESKNELNKTVYTIYKDETTVTVTDPTLNKNASITNTEDATELINVAGALAEAAANGATITEDSTFAIEVVKGDVPAEKPTAASPNVIEVHPELITTTGDSSTRTEISNSNLKGALTFKVNVGANFAGKTVTLTHWWKDGNNWTSEPIKEGNTAKQFVVDENGYVYGVTLNHFSFIDPTEVGGQTPVESNLNLRTVSGILGDAFLLVFKFDGVSDFSDYTFEIYSDAECTNKISEATSEASIGAYRNPAYRTEVSSANSIGNKDKQVTGEQWVYVKIFMRYLDTRYYVKAFKNGTPVTFSNALTSEPSNDSYGYSFMDYIGRISTISDTYANLSDALTQFNTALDPLKGD